MFLPNQTKTDIKFLLYWNNVQRGAFGTEWTTITIILIPRVLPCKFSFLHHILYFLITTPQIITSSIQSHNEVIFNSLLFGFQPN